ncbi:MAG: hypothetical protein ABI409_00690 [Ramlibacter sp.]
MTADLRGGFALAALLLAGCAAVAPAPRFGVATQVSNEIPCVNFTGPELAPGTPIIIEAFAPRQTIAARIRAIRGRCAPDGEVAGTAYSVDVPQGIEDIGLAVATLEARPAADLVFRSCSGSEGVHLTAWRHGARVWHEYFHLPYDIEPTCTPDQTRP